MDLDLIERLIRLLEESGIDQLEVEEEGLRVSLSKSAPGGVVYPASPPPGVAPGTVEATAPAAAEPEQPKEEGQPIEAPMVGTFYHAPAPDAAPYIDVGDEITEDTVVCIVEAMKVMNEIKAGVSGTVSKILAQNATAVEYGQPLFLVKP